MNNLATKISSLWGLCNLTKFPGTLASLIAFLLSFLVYYYFNGIVYIMIFISLLYFGFWSINKIHKEKGPGDYQSVGIDEVIGMWIANFFLFNFDLDFKTAFFLSLMSFAIFRIIDITKIIPPLDNINKKEKQDAMAVISDDVVAGVYTYFFLMIILGTYNFTYLYFSFFILLPAMIANMTPTIIKINFLNKPINEKKFGKNKTWRGFIGAIILGTITYIILIKFNLIKITGDENYLFFIGFLTSLGAIGGDLIKSFFKRKAGIGPGENFMPWDQIDYVLGMIILTYPFYRYDLNQIIILLVLGGWISAIFHRIGYLMKINSAKQ